MAEAYVNFYASMDPGGWTRGAQAYVGRASQAARDPAAVGATASAATAIVLAAGTEYVEIGAVDAAVFACILPSTSTAADRTAARIRIGAGQEKSLSRALSGAATLYIWAA